MRAELWAERLRGLGALGDKILEHLGNGKDPDHCRDQRNTLGEGHVAEREAWRSQQRIKTHRNEHETEDAGDDPLDQRMLGEAADDAHPED